MKILNGLISELVCNTEEYLSEQGDLVRNMEVLEFEDLLNMTKELNEIYEKYRKRSNYVEQEN